MQRLLLIILSPFFLLLSCRKSTPDGILAENKMVDLLAEVHTLDGYLNTLPLDSSRKVIDGLYGEIFDQYGVDSTRFRQNLAYYMGNPTLAKGMYVQVNKKLQDEDRGYREADSLENVRITDSIRVVQHYTRLRDEAYQLITQVYLDTIPTTYKMYRMEFMRRAGLSFPIFDRESIPMSGPVPLPEAGVQQPMTPTPAQLQESKEVPTPSSGMAVEGGRLKPVSELPHVN